MSIMASDGRTRVIYDGVTLRQLSANERIPEEDWGCHSLLRVGAEMHHFSGRAPRCDCGLAEWPKDFDD